MRPLSTLVLTLIVSGWAGSAWAFSSVKVGDALPAARLKPLKGKARPYLAAKEVTAFVFFRPGQEFSTEGLKELARVQERLKDRPVRWVGITSFASSPAIFPSSTTPPSHSWYSKWV